MTKNLDIEGFRSIVDNYQLFYVDLWGVVHNGVSLHAEAIKVLEESDIDDINLNSWLGEAKNLSEANSNFYKFKIKILSLME